MITLPSSRLAVSRSGSTLIELVVVLALVALLFGLTIPALTAIPAGAGTQQRSDSLRLAAVRSGTVMRSESVVAFPDGRLLARRAPHAR